MPGLEQRRDGEPSLLESEPVGHVVAVLPAGKANRLVLQDLVDRLFAALRDRTNAVLIDAYGLNNLEGEALEDYIASAVPRAPLTRGAVLTARSSAENNKEWRLHAERVAQGVGALRDAGHHVLVVGPWYLPDDEPLWVDWLSWCADGVVVLAASYELSTFMADPVEVLVAAAPTGAVAVLAYDDPGMPPPHRATELPVLDLGPLDASAGDLPSHLDAGIFPPLANVIGVDTFVTETTPPLKPEAWRPVRASRPTGPRTLTPVPAYEASTAAVPERQQGDPDLNTGTTASDKDLSRAALMQGFAAGIWAKVALLRERLSQRQRAALLASISVDIRKYCDIASPTVLVPRVSRQAASLARQLDVDPCQKVWQDQPAFDPGRVLLHLEHVVPVLTTRTACTQARTQADVVRALDGIEIAWIVKDEDRELTRLGYRSRRTDPEDAYRQAGIELVSCPHDGQ